ncbi:hypothetical protein BDR07DRAFT_701582 [Suillus spraguei]|nr:hypothetical protein BDR07DRAFT_701582 [Suillus spraguei]
MSRLYICSAKPGCNETFTKFVDFKRHEAAHSADGFTCTWPGCNFATMMKTSYDIHFSKHTGEKRYICPHDDCGYKTHDPALFTRHRQKQHAYVAQARGRGAASAKGSGGTKTKSSSQPQPPVEPLPPGTFHQYKLHLQPMQPQQQPMQLQPTPPRTMQSQPMPPRPIRPMPHRLIHPQLMPPRPIQPQPVPSLLMQPQPIPPQFIQQQPVPSLLIQPQHVPSRPMQPQHVPSRPMQPQLMQPQPMQPQPMQPQHMQFHFIQHKPTPYQAPPPTIYNPLLGVFYGPTDTADDYTMYTGPARASHGWTEGCMCPELMQRRLSETLESEYGYY